MHKTISKNYYETSIVSASFSCCAFLFKSFAGKFIAITRLLIFNVIDIHLICLSVIKWSTDMTTFTRIDGYGVHPPLGSKGKTVVQNSNKLKWNISSRKR